MAEGPHYSLVSVVPLVPDRAGLLRVALTCECGEVTDFTYPPRALGRSYTCGGCETRHWFNVPADGDD
jgi:hypothetical protein